MFGPPSDTQKFMLAALSSADNPRASYTPLEAQKLFFLLDKEASDLVGGTRFNFLPYDYGPFDKAVYEELDSLAMKGLVSVDRSGRYKRYSLTSNGLAEGAAEFGRLNPTAQQYIKDVANWLLTSTFQTIVSSIYARYPDMKVNSVFNR